MQNKLPVTLGGIFMPVAVLMAVGFSCDFGSWLIELP
jgi:hypothetical protein